MQKVQLPVKSIDLQLNFHIQRHNNLGITKTLSNDNDVIMVDQNYVFQMNGVFPNNAQEIDVVELAAVLRKMLQVPQPAILLTLNFYIFFVNEMGFLIFLLDIRIGDNHPINQRE